MGKFEPHYFLTTGVHNNSLKQKITFSTKNLRDYIWHQTISVALLLSAVYFVSFCNTVSALIECGVCVPSNYTGFYIKCNLLRNKENKCCWPPLYRPYRFNYSGLSLYQATSYTTTGLTMYQSTRYWTSGANKVLGHSATILSYSQTIYMATPLHQ